MEKIVIISFIFLLFYNSYSQEPENRFEIFPVSENYDVKNSCEMLEYYYYSSFILYVCSREKTVYTSLVKDTTTEAFDLKLIFRFTDTSTYLVLDDQIAKKSVLPLLSKEDKNIEDKFIRETIFQIMGDSKFYYEGDLYGLDEESLYFTMPLKFIPLSQKVKKDKVRIKKR